MVPSYPYSITEDFEDVPFTDCWYARTQLLFHCHLRPTGRRQPKNPSYQIGPDDLLFNLVFYSTSEELHFAMYGQMEDANVLKLYEPGPIPRIPCFYVAPVDHMVGRVHHHPLVSGWQNNPYNPSQV
jgi:hypothetical protein